jgi:hypothetical protein
MFWPLIYFQLLEELLRQVLHQMWEAQLRLWFPGCLWQAKSMPLYREVAAEMGAAWQDKMRLQQDRTK